MNAQQITWMKVAIFGMCLGATTVLVALDKIPGLSLQGIMVTAGAYLFGWVQTPPVLPSVTNVIKRSDRPE